MNTQLFIVIVNFNGYLDTIECLESIFKQAESKYKILVVDNSNSFDDIEKIRQWADGDFEEDLKTDYPEYIYPLASKPLDYLIVNQNDLTHTHSNSQLLIIKAKENNGFAAANNVALKYIQQFGGDDDLIWLLNNDTVIGKNTISQIKNKISTLKKGLYLFGTPLMEYYKKNEIQAIGGRYNKFIGLTYHVGEGIIYNNNIDPAKYNIDYPIGASIILTNDCLKKIGLMNEEYFLFYEEIDWMKRLGQLGGELKILNIFEVYHKQGKATQTKTKGSQKSEFIDILINKNRLKYARKYNRKNLLFVYLTTIFIAFNRIRKREFKRAMKILRLTLEH